MLSHKDNDWTFERLEAFDAAIKKIACEKYKLDIYPNQIEVISAEQMLDAYSSSAMPVMYPHWSFGKEYARNSHLYQKGMQNLAYEVVINSNPCISYLMEENTLTMQALVIAHACYGHNSFFKGNYLFRQWTKADSIVDYLVFAKKFIMDCEEKYGFDAVEEILDAAHALQNIGVDKYKRRAEKSDKQKEAYRLELEEYKRKEYNDLISKTSLIQAKQKEVREDLFPPQPEENVLYFIEKYSPHLKPWQKELVRIVRKMAQYFYPQGQTKVMNEGWATFWHYTLTNELFDQGLVDSGFMLEFLKSHTNVVYQPPMGKGQLNPYAFGFAIFSDIKRMCLNPTTEDKLWFPEIAGDPDWMKHLDYAMRNFKDESFIRQYLSPKVIRDFKLFAFTDYAADSVYKIKAIHDDAGYKEVRTLLANQYSREFYVPELSIIKYMRYSDRSLTLLHSSPNKRVLDSVSKEKTLHYLKKLWGFDVEIQEAI